jgi:hypothetical protein
MFWDRIISLSRYKILDIFQFHELLLKFFGFFAFESHLWDKLGFLLRFHDNFIVGGILMWVFKVMLNDILDFLFFLVDRTFLKLFVSWVCKSLSLKLQIGLILKFCYNFLLSFLWGFLCFDLNLEFFLFLNTWWNSWIVNWGVEMVFECIESRLSHLNWW